MKKVNRIDNVKNFKVFDKDSKKLIEFAYRTKNKLVIDSVSMELMRRLSLTIDNFNKKSSKQTKWIILLTIALGIIALLQLILLFIQI